MLVDQLPNYHQTYFRSVREYEQDGRTVVEHEIDQFPTHAKSVKRTLVSSFERDCQNPAYLSAVRFEMFYEYGWSHFAECWIDRVPKLWILGDGNGMVNIYTNGIVDQANQQDRDQLNWRLIHVGGGRLGDIEFRKPAHHLLPELGKRSLELAYYTMISTEDVPAERINIYNFDPGQGPDRISVIVDPQVGINLRYIAQQDQPREAFKIADLRQTPSGWVFTGEPEQPYLLRHNILAAYRRNRHE